MLAGRINPQAAWIGATPPSFRCPAGSSSQHVIRLAASAPKSWKPQSFKFDFLFLINSNGGSIPLSGEYISAVGKLPPRAKFIWSWVIMTALILVFLSTLIVGLLFLRRNLATRNENTVSQLYTQGAATVLAKVASTSTVMPPAPPPDSTVPAPAEMAATKSPAIEGTLTPWPRDAYPNPEVFIRDYYSAINYADYERAWSMLSGHFQENCCNEEGNDPFTVYSSWWKSVKQVEVLSAYLQQWDVNPAVIHVTLRYHMQDGRTLDAFAVFNVISDANRASLLIDEVK